jgi:HSP20 family protein
MDQSLRGQSQTNHLSPPVDVYEDEHGLEIALDLPGISPDNIQIEAENQTLTVQAERRYERQEGRTAHRVERNYGKYIRSFSVPGKYDLSAVTATYTHGLLTLSIPRSEASQRRKIAVHSGAQQAGVQTLEANSKAAQTAPSQLENARGQVAQNAQTSARESALSS